MTLIIYEKYSTKSPLPVSRYVPRIIRRLLSDLPELIIIIALIYSPSSSSLSTSMIP